MKTCNACGRISDNTVSGFIHIHGTKHRVSFCGRCVVKMAKGLVKSIDLAALQPKEATWEN